MRKFLWLAIAVIVVVAAWTAGWFWAAGEIRGQVERLAANDGDSAPKFSCATFNVTGFPFRFDLDCAEGTLVEQDLTVTFAGLRASVLVYNPTHAIFSAKGPFAYADAFSGSQRRLDFTGLDGSLRLVSADPVKGLSGEGWRLGRFSIEADDLAVTDTVAGDVREAAAKHVEAHLVDNPAGLDKTAGTSAVANYVTVSDLDLPGLQIAGGNATLEAQLSGLPADLHDFGAPDAIRRWQAAGGELDIVRFSGSQPNPEERFDVAGKLRLNAAGYPEGEINYTTKGVLERFADYVPAVQLAILRGAPQGEGNFSNTLTITDGQVKLLTVVFAQLLPLF
ncbi:DUF2125 domain-containing protein [Devosia sp. ZB163]|uniref:DUF2125 domain-containing protein n=1 Tax=Devosia sp. ZB163 TaxID=3025938 RepID=UPI0023618ACA|nr:DUF2125 domain-containing protein [Devosia sp. ZB163]MDC9826438.1 DUF2125 domain-containing protein [Devosia sp. ZB163]